MDAAKKLKLAMASIEIARKVISGAPPTLDDIGGIQQEKQEQREQAAHYASSLRTTTVKALTHKPQELSAACKAKIQRQHDELIATLRRLVANAEASLAAARARGQSGEWEARFLAGCRRDLATWESSPP